MEYEFTNFLRVLDKYAADFQKAYKDNLEKGDWKASGKLINSVKCYVTHNGNAYTVQMSLLDYWKYTEYGRGKTYNNGNGAVRRGILEWLKAKGIEPNDRSSLPREKKLERMSFAISKSIHENGWKKQANDKPFKTTLDAINAAYMPQIEAALKQDCEKIIGIIWNGVK